MDWNVLLSYYVGIGGYLFVGFIVISICCIIERKNIKIKWNMFLSALILWPVFFIAGIINLFLWIFRK